MSHKIDTERLTIEPFEALGELVSRSEMGINVYWADQNPALFGRSLELFLLQHPPEQWKITIQAAYMPGETWQVVAVRKEKGT